MKKQLLILAIFACFYSCNDIEDCQLDPNREAVGTRFVLLKPTEQPRPIAFDSIRLDGLFLFDLDTANSSLKDTISAAILLPIDVAADTSRFSFFTDSIDYFVTLSYDRQAYIYEVDCPAGQSYSNLRIVNTNIDSIRVVQTTLNKNTPTNLEIYL